jgi:hypothetical protein
LYVSVEDNPAAGAKTNISLFFNSLNFIADEFSTVSLRKNLFGLPY